MSESTRPFQNDAHEREWQAQERALRTARAQAGGRGDDALTQEYHLIAQMLNKAPEAELPADFAATVARRASAPEEPFASPFERVLLSLVVAAFGIAVALFGGDALRAAAVALALAGAACAKNAWVLALAACLALSAGLQFWQPRARRRPAP